MQSSVQAGDVDIRDRLHRKGRWQLEIPGFLHNIRRTEGVPTTTEIPGWGGAFRFQVMAISGQGT